MAKRRRTRTDHPGVKLKRVRHRSGVESWVARWRDPDSGREAQQSMEAVGRTNAEARRAWAIDKARELTRRKDALSRGEPPETGTGIEDAVAHYFDGADLKPATIAYYRTAIERFTAWCERAGVRTTDDLRARHLTAFRTALREEPARRGEAGGRRGSRKASGRLSTKSVNGYLGAIRVLLNSLRRDRLLPHVTKDDVTDQLRGYKADRPRVAFLRPAALRRLLDAVAKHDAARFAVDPDREPPDPERRVQTARELALALGVHESRVGQLRRERGWPEGPPWRVGDVLDVLEARHPPAAPLVLLALLTGARLEELLGLTWARVDLDHPDGVVEFAETKTGAGREVWLDVTPSLRRLLLALKLRATGPCVLGGGRPWTPTMTKRLRTRLVRDYNAPPFTFAQRAGETPSLRATNATYSTNAGGVWKNAAHSASAARLGHSVTIAEKRYVGRYRPPRDATDLEQAMEVADAVARLVDQVTGKPGTEAEAV